MRNNITVKGQWMYPSSANALLINMGSRWPVNCRWGGQSLTLDRANEAVESASAKGADLRERSLVPRTSVQLAGMLRMSARERDMS
jgi:hypothetical protein